jgi:hypothetical protein
MTNRGLNNQNSNCLKKGKLSITLNMDNISCKIMSSNEKLTHWENVLKKSFK